MGDASGTLRNLVLDGISYAPMADVNMTEIHSSVENEGVPTSGDTIIKKTRRVQLRENVVVKANANEAEALKGLAERIDNFSMSYTNAAGDVYRTTGTIDFENKETEENRATIKLIPTDADGWVPFIA